MLKRLRIQLTLLFLFSGILLVGVLGASLYIRLEGFFRSSTDIALKYRLALELRNLQAPISPDIEAAEKDFINRSQSEGKFPTPTVDLELDEELEGINFNPLTHTPSPTLKPVLPISPTKKPAKPASTDDKEGDESEPEDSSSIVSTPVSLVPLQTKSFLAKPRSVQLSTPTPTAALIDSLPVSAQSEPNIDNSFDSELSAIFVNYIDSSGGVIPAAFSNRSPFKPDFGAILAARKTGIDVRTVAMADGTPVRYLTYLLPEGYPAGFIQLGRKIDDQVRLLNEYLMNMLVIGLILLILLGLGSWWLAGRAVIPTQRSLDQQQAFIANASHELRTPLTLIRASTELATRSTPPGEAKKLMTDVLGDVDYMAKLVEDLLLLSRLDNQKIILAMEPVQIEMLFGDIQRQFEPLVSTNQVRLTLKTLPEQIMADPDRMRQLLWILIDNAIQHTPRGGEVTLSAEKDKESVHIRVTDNGAGIPEEDIPHVFERFFKGRNSHSKSRGAGLGLSIARSLVEAQRGTIQIESVPGRGTRVTITLDSAQAPKL